MIIFPPIIPSPIKIQIRQSRGVIAVPATSPASVANVSPSAPEGITTPPTPVTFKTGALVGTVTETGAVTVLATTPAPPHGVGVGVGIDATP